MTGLQEYILTAWLLKTPFAARLWKIAGLPRTTPGKLSQDELEALRRVILDRWPALAGKRASKESSRIAAQESLALALDFTR